VLGHGDVILLLNGLAVYKDVPLAGIVVCSLCRRRRRLSHRQIVKSSKIPGGFVISFACAYNSSSSFVCLIPYGAEAGLFFVGFRSLRWLRQDRGYRAVLRFENAHAASIRRGLQTSAFAARLQQFPPVFGGARMHVLVNRLGQFWSTVWPALIKTQPEHACSQRPNKSGNMDMRFRTYHQKVES
jgi:hypothetical protein